MVLYTKLDEVIKSLLIQMGEQTEHKYMQLLDIGIRGVKELSMDTTQQIKVVSLTVNDNLTADLPCDYINYRRIGICEDGQLKSLGLDSNMCIATEFNGCGAPMSRASGKLVNNENIYWSYGLGGGNNKNGYYRINKETNQIALSSDFVGGSLVLEYISDGSGESGEYEIHVFGEEALRSYIWWKHLQRKKNIPLQEKELARRDWYNEKRIATARFSSFNKEEALQASRINNKLSPKL